ncbi:MAG: hypothetical protein JXR48_06925 [Candidatus Delongbacteria bacterium]|nr:hypothetical protein [Candidatus Delongbacteria bacterium]MBN2834684.1 hypothetical protein [Candidatus Delongbacteria bacterium]
MQYIFYYIKNYYVVLGKLQIKQALKLSSGNQTKAEKLLNLGAKTLNNRLQNFPELKEFAKTRK